MTERRKNIAGMSIGGGRKENFFFCLLEYFKESDRWFLSSLHHVKEEDEKDGDEAIAAWIEKYKLENLIVDFPLSRPVCDGCELKCPGTQKCHHEKVVTIRQKMDELLQVDSQMISANPKKYEQERVHDNMVHYSRDLMGKEAHNHLLSRPFKRKLKKGFIPYWNRPIDFWVWKHYYDQLLGIFKISFDSFSNVSMMLLSKFKYLIRHLPDNLKMNESNVHLCLLELYRSKIIALKNIEQLNDIDQQVLGRLEIIRCIEKKLNVFIYEHDMEMIVKNPKAFDSFLLALVGISFTNNKLKEIPSWALPDESRFIVPSF